MFTSETRKYKIKYNIGKVYHLIFSVLTIISVWILRKQKRNFTTILMLKIVKCRSKTITEATLHVLMKPTISYLPEGNVDK